MLTSVLGRVVAPFDACPWGGTVGRAVSTKSDRPPATGLYTPAQRLRRALYTGALAPHGLMMLALAAYATYVVNAAQFVIKLRAARREERAVSWRLQAPAGYGFGQQA